MNPRRDTTSIFGAVAPLYYAKGLPVIPLMWHEKKPIPSDWSRFHDQLPDADLQQQWIQQHAAGNIGLVLGEQSGISVIDIDTDDANLTRMILDVLPPSPWHRIGAKGRVIAFRYNGVPTFRIKDTEGRTLVEHLSSRTQVVLPPSIHPSTGRPYHADKELLDVYDDLPLINGEIESILRGLFKREGVELSTSGWTRITEFVPTGSRDVKMTQISGHYAASVVRGERTLLEAIGLLRGWHATQVEKLAGDDIDVEKGVANLVKFVIRDVVDRKKVLPKGWDDGLSKEDKERLQLNFTDDNEEWDFQRMKDYLLEQFDLHPAGSINRMNAIYRILDKIATAPNMETLDREKLIKYISEASGEGLTVSAIRKQLRDLASGPLAGEDHAEIAKAVIDQMEQYGPLRFSDEQFWTWGGSHWVNEDVSNPGVSMRQKLLTTIITDYGSYPAAKRDSDHKGIVKVITSLVPHALKSNSYTGVNFANGFLQQDGKLYPHDPSYGMTYTLPFRYLPEEASKAHKFQHFLQQCWGDDEDFQQKVDALQEAICVTIFGLGPKLQRVVLLSGAPKSGKSQMLKIVSSMVPDNARSVCPPDTWGDKFAPVTMANKILNVCGELSEKRLIDGQRFKEIVDGNEIQMQYKGGQVFKAPTICTHWFASNHFPRTEDTSEGFNRRWLILTFNKPIDPSKRILDFGEVLVAEEREAIAAWAIEALPRLMGKNEYTLPDSHHQAIREVANMNNSVRFFLQESGLVRISRPDSSKPLTIQDVAGLNPSLRTSEMKVHNAYFSFCLGAGGAKPVSLRPFRQRMRELAAEMGFRLNITTTEKGTQDCEYLFLTLAA